MATKPLNKIIQYKAYKIVFWQLAGVMILAALSLVIAGLTNGLSVLAGGLCYGIPNLIFVWLVFRFTGAQQMNQFMTAFFAGEAIKLILSGILFVVVVKTLSVSLLSVLIGFAGAIVSFWIVCMWQFSKQDSLR